jgi:hypothetical protein
VVKSIRHPCAAPGYLFPVQEHIFTTFPLVSSGTVAENFLPFFGQWQEDIIGPLGTGLFPVMRSINSAERAAIFSLLEVRPVRGKE